MTLQEEVEEGRHAKEVRDNPFWKRMNDRYERALLEGMSEHIGDKDKLQVIAITKSLLDEQAAGIQTVIDTAIMAKMELDKLNEE